MCIYLYIFFKEHKWIYKCYMLYLFIDLFYTSIYPKPNTYSSWVLFANLIIAKRTLSTQIIHTRQYSLAKCRVWQ